MGPLIDGRTSLIAHIGYPTHTFKSPLIYNPYFASAGINTVVVPMGCQAPDFPELLRSVFKLTNIVGALITMPHKVTTVGLLDEVSTTVKIAGACNAVRRDEQGRLVGDLFDGEGFVRGVQRKGLDLHGKHAMVVGAGGVGSAIAASLAAHGVAQLSLYDVDPARTASLGSRLRQYYPAVQVHQQNQDPHGLDLVVNATPMGMNPGDPLPLDVERLTPNCFVGEVVMRTQMTAFLAQAQAKGCRIQVGTDMLFEQIPEYLAFFGLPTTTAETLRALAQVSV